MKKYSIVISLFAMLLTACDPTVEEEGSIAASMTEAQLEQAATLMQTVEGQNKFTYGRRSKQIYIRYKSIHDRTDT